MIEIRVGDCRELLRAMPEQSVHTCVTSPPYFGLRDYGVDGQIGMESTPEAFVAELVAVFREVRRVLRDDGTLWLNLGDCYAGSWGNQGRGDGRGTQRAINRPMLQRFGKSAEHAIDCDMGWDCTCGAQEYTLEKYPQRTHTGSWVNDHPTLKPKDLIGIPWRVAFALQADGWYLRQDIIWHKPNPMPESVRDRCTKSHEYVFLLSKSERYFYDANAISEPAIHAGRVVEYDGSQKNSAAAADPKMRTRIAQNTTVSDSRNKRSVWSITTQPFSGAHFATMPPELAETCVKAGCPSGGTVLDPFGGAGTTGLVADRLGRSAILCELNPQYADIARNRIRDDAPLFAEVA